MLRIRKRAIDQRRAHKCVRNFRRIANVTALREFGLNLDKQRVYKVESCCVTSGAERA